ncbi:MAG: hypothetical protein J0L66_14535 [Cytophagales bacterium]|nr:hypothetical protein [Cytophagales bacterium]
MLKQLTFLWLTLFAVNLYGQDEGLIEQKARFERPHSIAVQIGPQFRLGKADYTGGYSISLAYTNRVNRILSLGPSIGFSRFAFQPSLTNSFKKRDVKGNNIFQEDGAYEVYVVTLRGGDLNQYSAGINFKLDLVPFKADQKVRWNIGVEPYLVASSRSEVTATTQVWTANEIPLEDPSLWSGGDVFIDVNSASPGRSNWSSKTELSGGFLASLGVEFMLPGNWSLSAQPMLCYLFPITHIKTANFPRLQNEGYFNSNYPFAKESFITAGVMVAISHNF